MIIADGYGSIPVVHGEVLESDYSNKVKELMFIVGSCLTEPFLKSDEYLKRCYTVEALNKDSGKCEQITRKFFLIVGMFGWGALGLLTTLPGFFFGALPTLLQSKPYIYAQYEVIPKSLPSERLITLLSWNVCCIGASLTITDAGVTPTSFREGAILENIIDANADIACLSEVFDVITARYFKEKLAEAGYRHFFFHIGPKAIGLSSGLFIASRYSVQNPEFAVFSRFTGWAGYSKKGVFSFDIMDNRRALARIHATHLQHSEKPAEPERGEVESRIHQLNELERIANKVSATFPQVITGDFNMDEEELAEHPLSQKFSRGDVIGDEKTWEGDAWCAKQIYGKPATAPMNLDYTIGKNVALTTRIAFETFFKEGAFTEKALSDHKPLLSYIKI